MLTANASHVLGRPLSTMFTNSFSEVISSIAYSRSLSREILTKYDVMLSSSFIFMSRSSFFRLITCPMFLTKKRFVRASYIFFNESRWDMYGIKWSFMESTMILMALMSMSLNFSLAAMFCGSFSSSSLNSGFMIFPFTISNTLFLARMRSILVFHALKSEAQSNLFSDFIEFVMACLTWSNPRFDQKSKLHVLAL
jgi:hypothetical protein